MSRVFSRRTAETVVAAALATAAVLITAARGGDEKVGPKHLALQKIGRFREPVFVAQPPHEDKQLFVVGRLGTIWALKGGDRQAKPFLDIRDRVRALRAEQGLFSVAFPPDYSETGAFYVAYTNRDNDVKVVEFRRSRQNHLLADPASGRVILTIPEPTQKHHGGLLLFGPDRHLYIGSGDGGPSFDPNDVSQSTKVLLGKILRIDPHPEGKKKYTVPRDNPFARGPGRDEIYSYGLRNPWRFSFDRATGALAIGDVGQDRFEEVDIVPAGKAKGANFGWPAYEGFGKLKQGVKRRLTVQPTLAYPHGPGCSVIGGYVVRDPQLARIKGRELVGRYLFGDYCTGKLSSVRTGLGRGGGVGRDHPIGLKVDQLTSFGEDREGHIYVVSQSGPVYRIVATRKR
ncbi:MAG: PQQ-dependent sugar dehydrogenase [Solirubrobacterales bacterium]